MPLRMPTPVFALRLTQKTQDDLAIMSKIYGSPNPRAFAREMLETMVSGDMEKVKGFVGRLVQKAGEQLTLKLNAALDSVGADEQKGESPRPKRKVSKKGRRGRVPR